MQVLKPLLYAAAMSCLTTGLMIGGGSNLAKMAYHQTVLSRQEEIKANKDGTNTAEARQAALVKKVPLLRMYLSMDR
eukprot:SAG25_NODE_3606_length_1025_cov_1.028078_2_plen_77_part_00